MATQRFKKGDRVTATPVKDCPSIIGTVTYVGSDGAVEVIQENGSGGMYSQEMVNYVEDQRS